MVMKAVLNVIKVRFLQFWLLLGYFGYFLAVLGSFWANLTNVSINDFV